MSSRHLEPDEITYFTETVSPDRFSMGDSQLDLHSRDQSHHGPHRPAGVIWPADANEVSAILAYCNTRRIPVTAWGAGSSLEGNPLPVFGGLVMNMSQMDRILDIRPQDFQADVEPGVVYQDLNEKLRPQGLFFPPDPGARATIGGMTANNSAGTRTVRYGATRDYILKLELVLADGEIIHTGSRSAKTSSGYDLVDLFVGSEGTLGVATQITVRLAGTPEEESAAVVSFDDMENAARTVFEIMRAGLSPAALELMDRTCVALLNKEENLGLEDSSCLIMEFHGPSRAYLGEVLDLACEIAETHGGKGFTAGLGRAERDRLWHARHKLGEIIIRTNPGAPPLSLDVAMPISNLPDVIAASAREVESAGVPGYIFGHAGDGNLHVVLCGREGHQGDWEAIERVNTTLVKKVLDLGGTATGEHGVGLGKRKFMDLEHGSSLAWMKRIKHLFDPNNILNPGKIF
jgi:D-lactate dehydrogenase (cytochrome)